MKIDQTQDWRKKHWMAIKMNYAKAPYFERYQHFFKMSIRGSGNISMI